MVGRLSSVGLYHFYPPSTALWWWGFVWAWPPWCHHPEVWRRTTQGCWGGRSDRAEGRTDQSAASPTLGWMKGEKTHILDVLQIVFRWCSGAVILSCGINDKSWDTCHHLNNYLCWYRIQCFFWWVFLSLYVHYIMYFRLLLCVKTWKLIKLRSLLE